MPRQKKTSREMIEAGEAPYDGDGRYAGGRGTFYDQVLHATYGHNDDVYLVEEMAKGVNADHVLNFDLHRDVIEQMFELLITQPIARPARKASASRKLAGSEYISEQQYRTAYTAIKLLGTALKSVSGDSVTH